ncbi:MAG: hypothetical protein IMF12_08840 [Proteobacteria bacterium]|nr:hypothetical protein [Pseudomonadota bacterium]
MKITAVVALAILLIPMASFADDAAKKAAVTDMVRALGYGGAIHNFKNYVLRGKDKYNRKADTSFQTAQTAIQAFRNAEPTKMETAVLDDINQVIQLYRDALPIIQVMIGKKTAKEIDAGVKISDGPAISGIAKLRKGHEWGALAEIEYALGYGCGIHQFKNYVLRGDARREKAETCFTTAETAIKKLDGAAGVTRVIAEYKAALATTAEMIDAGKTAEEIDGSVKISDNLAKDNLKVLRK